MCRYVCLLKDVFMLKWVYLCRKLCLYLCHQFWQLKKLAVAECQHLHSLIYASIIELCCWLHCVGGEYLAAAVYQLREGEGGHAHLPAVRSEPQPVDTDRSRPVSQTAVSGCCLNEGEARSKSDDKNLCWALSALGGDCILMKGGFERADENRINY